MKNEKCHEMQFATSPECICWIGNIYIYIKHKPELIHYQFVLQNREEVQSYLEWESLNYGVRFKHSTCRL
jgi:hypothetical protein